MIKLVLSVFCLLPVFIYAQSLRGTITDENGIPLQNVNVLIEGLEKGTTTSAEGTFRFNGLPKDTLTIIVSHVGCIPQKIQIDLTGSNIIKTDIVLKYDLIRMPEIVISAETNNQHELIRIPSRTLKLEAKDIAKLPAISASDIFSGISGVNVQSEAGMFSSSSVSIRGVGGNSQTGTLIVLNGMPLNKSDGGSVNWNIIDKDNIETIEVIKGPGSALFGSNAMGGIINIITKQPQEHLKGTLSMSYGTFNTPEGRLTLSGMSRNKQIFWNSYAFYRKSDGYINTPDEIIAENDTIVVPVFLEDIFAGAQIGYNFSKDRSIEFSFNYFNDVRGRGTKIFEEIGSATHRDTYQAFIKFKGISGKWKTYANMYGLKENYFRLNEYYSDGEYKLYEVDSRRNDYGLRFWGNLRKNMRNEIIAGGEIRLGSVNAMDIYYTSTDLISNRGMMDIFALFIQKTHFFENEKWIIMAGLRYDFARFHDAAFSIENPSYSVEYFVDFQFDNVVNQHWSALNPKFTLQYRPNIEFRWYSTFAKGFRAPVLDDMCRSERSMQGLRIANPQLKAEHVYNVETGVDKLWGNKFSTQFSVYYTMGSDFMQLLSTGDSVNLGYTIAPVYEMSNISNVNIFGGEADINFRFSKHLNAFGNYTYIHAKVGEFIPRTEADTDLSRKFLANVPMHGFSLGIVLLSKVCNLSLATNYIGERWIKDDNSVDEIFLLKDKYPSVIKVDARVWKKSGDFEISVDINNIFNIVYINSKGYKSPGRMMFLKLAYNFQPTTKE